MESNIKVLSIIEIINGMLQPPTSYVITPDNETEMVEKAETRYLELIQEHIEDEIDEDDKQDYLDEETYTDECGYEVSLVWSDIIEN